MRIEHVFIADDGHRFSTVEDCTNHEILCGAVARYLLLMKPPPKSEREFVQQDRTAVLALQRFVTARIGEASGRNLRPFLVVDYPIGLTIVGRLADECGPPAVRAAMYRIQCMDMFFREWTQPALAIEANKRSEGALR